MSTTSLLISLLLIADLGMAQTLVTNLVKKEPASAQFMPMPLVWREPVAETSVRFTPANLAGRANVAIASKQGTNAVLVGIDKLLVETVRKRWYDLLSNSSQIPNSASVILEFQLHSDGRVTGLRILGEPTDKVFSLMATRAVLDSAPYPKSVDGTESRAIRLKFSLRDKKLRDKPNDASLQGIDY